MKPAPFPLLHPLSLLSKTRTRCFRFFLVRDLVPPFPQFARRFRLWFRVSHFFLRSPTLLHLDCVYFVDLVTFYGSRGLTDPTSLLLLCCTLLCAFVRIQ